MEADIRVDANLELVKQMGSKQGYDPIPPSQYLYFLTDPDPVQRVVAWTRSRTIRLGHRSKFAVEADGEPSTIQDLADTCFNGDWTNAKRAWQRAESQKLVAKDGAERLCLCGNVPSREAQREVQQKQPDTENSPVCTDWWKICTDRAIPTYVREAMEHHSEEEREAFAGAYLRFLSWSEAIAADAIAAARAEVEKQERLLFGSVGIERRNGRKKRDLETKPLAVQLSLIEEPDFGHQSVQTGSVQPNEASVQTGKNDLYRPENGVVQSAQPPTSLYTKQSIKTEVISPSSSALCDERKPEEREISPPVHQILKTAPTPKGDSRPRFDQWWSIYWRKAARKPAEDAFRLHVKTEERFQQVMAATREQTPAMMARKPNFRPYAASWLNAERWNDQPSPPATNSSNGKSLVDRTEALWAENLSKGLNPFG